MSNDKRTPGQQQPQKPADNQNRDNKQRQDQGTTKMDPKKDRKDQDKNR